MIGFGRTAAVVASALALAACEPNDDRTAATTVAATSAVATTPPNTTTTTSAPGLPTEVTAPPAWDLTLGPIGLSWGKPDRMAIDFGLGERNTDLPKPRFESNDIAVEIDGIVFLDSRLAEPWGSSCRDLIVRALWEQGDDAAERDTTCMLVSYAILVGPEVVVTPQAPVRLRGMRSFDSILVLPPAAGGYDPEYGARVTPGEVGLHVQEYIDAAPGARIGFDVGTDASGFASFEYEVPDLSAFQPVDPG